MVIGPLGIQQGNLGVEILAQTSRSSLAQAQQTAQMHEILRDNIRKAQEIQPSDEVLSAEKVHRKTDEEYREGREEQEEKKQKTAQEEEEEQKTALGVAIQKNGRYDFYV
jgi:predicted  nucleic acid-binding Zn-ribbon protein